MFYLLLDTVHLGKVWLGLLSFSNKNFYVSKYLYLYFTNKWYLFLDSIVVSIPACHAGDRGSIPRRGDFFTCLSGKTWHSAGHLGLLCKGVTSLGAVNNHFDSFSILGGGSSNKITWGTVRKHWTWYRVCHWFRLMKQDNYFWVDFDHF